MPGPVTLRPRGGQVVAWIAIVIAVAALVYLAVDGGLGELVRWAWPIVALGWVAWLLYIRPYVRVTPGFVEVSNILRTHRVPWGDIDHVDSRFALTLHTNGGRSIRAWAAPAPGARQGLRTRREDVAHSPGDTDTRRPSDAEGTASGDAFGFVTRELEAYRRGRGATHTGGTATSWNLVLVGVTAALVAAALLSLLLPHA
ncbi:hypothetical protein GCM10009808_04070 [Microbacterium sediminicola]|uniref:Low molecular weight protein antigen 6 PH domain-containing protein n=1 Tax=Microbacterium sediminicola TaxID=415210 RepID=A0ABN2HMH2_9MICO